MSIGWWSLPGPAAFIDLAVEDLRDGKNVVICLPEATPHGIVASIRDSCQEIWRWEELPRSSREDPCPPDALLRIVAPDRDPRALATPGALTQLTDFGGRLFWLSDLTDEAWERWRAFLADYAEACRAVPLLERSLFCVAVQGAQALRAPAEEICLSVRRSASSVDLLDAEIHAASLLRGRAHNPLLRKVTISVIARLSMWDRETAERLARLDLTRLFSPEESLQRVAHERGWDPPSPDQEVMWSRGQLDVFDGQPRLHSALCALQPPSREIRRRIWAAQVGVLLPHVEEQRRELIEELDGELVVPFTTRFGEEITDLYDLEIGHIEYQLDERRWVGRPGIRRIVRRLRSIRNRLAHLDPVAVDVLREKLSLRELGGRD